MFLKTYEKFIILNYFKNLALVTLIFAVLSFFLNVLEEIKFFSVLDENFYYPFLLTLLNVPSILFTVFPFIFLISAMIFFLNLYEKNELIIFKIHGLNNLKILFLLTLSSLIAGILVVLIFHSFSAKMKHSYFSFKNNFTNDNKYLAMVNENGLWLKDEVENNTLIINANKYFGEKLENITITELDENFNLIKTIVSEEAIIKNKIWNLNNAKIYVENQDSKLIENYTYETNFNSEKISNIFSNLSSLNILQLKNLIEDYTLLGYSTVEIDSYLLSLYLLPCYLIIMTILGSIVMFNVKQYKSKTLSIIIGILASVVIYYISYFSNLLGENDRVPILISILLPQIIFSLVSLIGIIGLNEK